MAPVCEAAACADFSVAPVLMAMIGLPASSARARRLHEYVRSTNAFDEQDDLLGMFVVDKIVDVIGKIQIEFVSGRNALGKLQAPRSAGAHEELQRAAGLKQTANRPRSELRQA